jgi:hypothetical protein
MTKYFLVELLAVALWPRRCDDEQIRVARRGVDAEMFDLPEDFRTVA